MTATPMLVQTRPFAIEPFTNIMLPDGIFDNAIYSLNIACHYTNTGGTDLTNVSLYLESVGDPGIDFNAQTFFFNSIAAGASVMVMWKANFQSATPGKTLVSFVAQSDGHTSQRSIRQIFVSQTRYDTVAKKFVCTIGEGRMEVLNIFAIKPAADWCSCSDGGRAANIKGGGDCPDLPGPHVPTGIRFVWYPNPSFSGQHSDLPFSDPWWKVLAIIVAIIAAIVGAIAAAAGQGAFNVGVSGTYDDDPDNPTVHCCTPKPGGSIKNDATTVAGVCGAITSVAIAVACSDAADPIWRGQENTHPAAHELTVAEAVDARWSFLEPPNAGEAYRTKVKWRYERITNGATYSYEVEEDQTNIHVLDKVELDTPATVPIGKPLWVRAKFQKPDGTLFKGPELYAFVFFRSPGGYYFFALMGDDGQGFDAKADDGIYTAALNYELAYRELLDAKQEMEGVWRVYVYAQDVNRTLPGTLPVIAAQTIGGSFLTSAVSITFDPSLPCPLKSQASITVV
jgi:hypothetical protein